MYSINDGSPVVLGCRVENGALVLTRNGAPLGSGELEVQLSPTEEITITISDFTHDGSQYQINAFTTADGVRTSWERIGEGVRSPALRATPSETLVHEVTVEAMSYVVSGESARPASTYAPAAVKVRLPPPEDSRPEPPGD